jgi:autotransporter-associated beta strand protein
VGALALWNTGTVTLLGSNSYQGTTTISAGALVDASLYGLPNPGGTGALVVNNSSLTILSGTRSTVGTNTFAGTAVLLKQLTGNGALNVGATGTNAFVQFNTTTGNSTASSVTVATGSTLDIKNNKLTINSGSAAADTTNLAAVLTALQAGTGVASGDPTWKGAGLTSSTAATIDATGGNLHPYGVGYLDGDTANDYSGANAIGNPKYALQRNQIIVKYVLAGDAFLQNTVGLDDLSVLAQNYGTTGHDWAGGDWDYNASGTVGLDDLSFLIQNYGFGDGLSEGAAPGGGGVASLAWQSSSIQTSVPEPGGVILAIGALCGGLWRRRRRRS